MSTATQAFHPRVDLVFDFDLTLAPGSVEAVLADFDLSYEEFEDRLVAPLVDDGWDSTLAKVFTLVRLSRSGQGPRITRELLQETGRRLQPFEGVPEMFGRLRDVAAEIDEEIEVRFHLVSSGLVDIMRATSIAPEFETVWGTELHFDEDTGEVAFAKAVVTHPEKERYLLALSKGLDPSGQDGPEDVYRDVEDADMAVPMDQIVYTGDGASDMPVFRLMHRRGGTAIGVFKESARNWAGLEQMNAGRRVMNLAEADYRPGSELMRSLELAVRSIVYRTLLKGLSRGE